jgi:glycosyltransferase involved in cell wall biosynthesis
MQPAYHDQKLIGIVIPAYYVSPYIRETLLSVLSQNESNWLAVVVDDGSPDDILGPVQDLLKMDSRLTYVRKSNGGVASARNHGLRLLFPKVNSLMFLDGDDVLAPEALGILQKILDQSADVGLAYCRPKLIDEHSQPLADQTWLPRWSERQGRACLLPERQSDTPFDAIYCLGGPLPSTALIRKEAIGTSHEFDEAFGHNMEDTDFFLRIALNWKVTYCPQTLTHYRRRAGQSSSSVESLNQQARKLYEKWSAMKTLTAAERAIVEKAERFRMGPLKFTQGWRAGGEAWAAGDKLKALRFRLGAIRRWPGQSVHMAWQDFWRCGENV